MRELAAISLQHLLYKYVHTLQRMENCRKHSLALEKPGLLFTWAYSTEGNE